MSISNSYTALQQEISGNQDLKKGLLEWIESEGMRDKFIGTTEDKRFNQLMYLVNKSYLGNKKASLDFLKRKKSEYEQLVKSVQEVEIDRQDPNDLTQEEVELSLFEDKSLHYHIVDDKRSVSVSEYYLKKEKEREIKGQIEAIKSKVFDNKVDLIRQHNEMLLKDIENIYKRQLKHNGMSRDEVNSIFDRRSDLTKQETILLEKLRTVKDPNLEKELSEKIDNLLSQREELNQRINDGIARPSSYVKTEKFSVRDELAKIEKKRALQQERFKSWRDNVKPGKKTNDFERLVSKVARDYAKLDNKKSPLKSHKDQARLWLNDKFKENGYKYNKIVVASVLIANTAKAKKISIEQAKEQVKSQAKKAIKIAVKKTKKPIVLKSIVLNKLTDEQAAVIKKNGKELKVGTAFKYHDYQFLLDKNNQIHPFREYSTQSNRAVVELLHSHGIENIKIDKNNPFAQNLVLEANRKLMSIDTPELQKIDEFIEKNKYKIQSFEKTGDQQKLIDAVLKDVDKTKSVAKKQEQIKAKVQDELDKYKDLGLDIKQEDLDKQIDKSIKQRSETLSQKETKKRGR